MRFLVIALVVVSLQTSTSIRQEKGVYVLTDSNFNDFINDHEYAFLFFYSPWCDHCKKIKPEISKLAALIKKQKLNIAIGKVDATIEQDLGDIFAIERYPTFKFFVRAEPIDFNGDRTAKHMLDWIQKRLHPTASEISSLEEVDLLQKERLAALLITSSDQYGYLKNFEKLAVTLDGIPFRYTFSDDIRNKLDATDNTFVLFKGSDGLYEKFTSETLTFDEMKEFFHKHKHSLVVQFDKHAAERIFGGKHSAIFLMSDSPKLEHLKILKDYAQSIPNQLVFSHSTISGDPGDKLAEFFDITTKDDPTAVIINFRDGKHLIYRLESADMDTLGNFIEQYLQGTLSPYYKSEPIPEPFDSPIKTVVGKNFDELILNNDNYVLLKVYAPWCQHSKAFAQIYAELAYKLRDVDDLVIAEMDGTANEHPAIKIEGFPTLLLFKREDKNHPVEFTGARMIKELMAFLEEELGRDLSESEEIPIDSGL